MNGECVDFRAGGDCCKERLVFRRVVLGLVDEFGLEGVADRILVERVAMYLVRIARAETYELFVGVSEKSVLWGGYIGKLDNTLQGLMSDLAVTRMRRLQLERNESLLVSVDELMRKFARAKGRSVARGSKRRLCAVVSGWGLILAGWQRDYETLLRLCRSGGASGGQEES